MSLIKTSGFVLKYFPLAETDKIVSIYSMEMGKIRAVAKGARRPGSRFTGALDPFRELRFVLYKSQNSTLYRINEVNTLNRFKSIPSDLSRLSVGYELLEVLYRFTPTSEPNDPLFRFVRDTFRLLDRSAASPEWIRRYFRFGFFSISGYSLELQHCIHCRKPRNNRAANVCVFSGGVVCRECLDPDAMKIVVSGRNLAVIERMIQRDLPDEFETRELMASFLAQSNAITRDMFVFHFDAYPRSDAVFSQLPDSESS